MDFNGSGNTDDRRLRDKIDIPYYLVDDIDINGLFKPYILFGCEQQRQTPQSTPC